MDRRSRAQQWRRARHGDSDLCPPLGRRAAAALLWLSCSIALLRALAASSARAQQRAAQQRRGLLSAQPRAGAPGPELERGPPPPPGCPEDRDEFGYESETESETESDTGSEVESETETETAPTTEPETEPEDERGPAAAPRPGFGRSLAERLHALRLRSPDAAPRPAEGEERAPGARDPRAPEEAEQPRAGKRQPRRCRPRKPARRDPSPESPQRGPIPIRRH